MCVCLSRFYGLYLAYYGLDLDQTWWKCWNFGSIDCIKISLFYAARAFYFLHFYVSEHFKSLRHTIFLNFCERKEQNVRERSDQDASANMLRQTVTLATAIFLCCLHLRCFVLSTTLISSYCINYCLKIFQKASFYSTQVQRYEQVKH